MGKFRRGRNIHRVAVAVYGALSASAGIAAETAEPDALQEVVVTATRRNDVANKVPITISAVTQETLDQEGIKTAADLTRIVPSLNAVANPGGGQETFSIRGIVGSTGAATTSVYLDDVNLTKRANGGVAQNNGVLIPILYDLARVEVLKGPQGTLFGGSSEGGTIRFITPAPSLTDYSGTGRAEFSTMGSRSAPSFETGGAVGGPIIPDKLAFRVSAIKQEYGGWVDEYSAYTGDLIKKNDNTSIDWASRVALLWQISANTSAQVSAYHVENKYEGGPGTTTAIYVGRAPAPAGQTFTTQGRCITNNTRTAPLVQPNGAPAATFIPTNVACASAAAVPGTVYFRPGVTYGPFPQGQDVALATGIQNIEPATAQSDIVSTTLNFDLQLMNVKLISSYLSDKGHSDTTGGEEFSSTTTGAGQFTTLDPAHRGFPLFAPFYNATGAGNTGLFDGTNKRHGVEEEVRFASVGDNHFNWVAGIYFSNANTEVGYNYLSSVANDDLVMQELYGPTFAGPAGNTSASTARYGVVNNAGYQARLAASIQDREIAAFTEWNVWLIPDRLKAIVGARFSGVELNYYQTNYGQFSGRLPSSIGSVTQGHSTDSPFTPKYGLQYQLNDQSMVYATASRGFRAGGVNAQISQTICETALNQIGITASDVPAAYKPDTVWSYELGGKFRLFEKLQLNLAAYRINWNGIQATTTLSCGQGFTSNGGRAESKGAEAQLVFQPLHQLSFYLNAGYTDAFYVDPVKGPVPTLPGVSPTPSFNPGDKFNIPPFQASTGGEFDLPFSSRFDSFLRIDYTYQNAYNSGATFGSSGYGSNYFTGHSPSQDQVNLRVGVRLDSRLDVNVFVFNLLDREKQLNAPLTGINDGRGSCSASSINCSSYLSYNPFVTQLYQAPRRFGVQFNYKY
jgi:iron complex outermembrane recepter protein